MISVTLEPARLPDDRSTNAVVRLRNTGTGACITVILEFQPPTSLILERGRRTIEFSRIEPGTHEDHPITLRPCGSGRHSIAIVNFSFRDGSGRAHYASDCTIEVDVYPVVDPPAPRPTARPSTQILTGRSMIFVSHRRSESRWFVDHLVRYLREHFPGQRIYFDRGGNRPGENFQTRIDSELRSCGVLLALIGPQWATVVTADGGRRIDERTDVVRREISTALGRGIPVIPVLFDGARMPNGADLPTELRGLADLQAVEVDLERFKYDVLKLIFELRRILDPP